MKVRIEEVKYVGKDEWDADRWRVHINVDGRATILEVGIDDDDTHWTYYKMAREIESTEEEFEIVRLLRRVRAGDSITFPLDVVVDESARVPEPPLPPPPKEVWFESYERQGPDRFIAHVRMDDERDVFDFAVDEQGVGTLYHTPRNPRFHWYGKDLIGILLRLRKGDRIDLPVQLHERMAIQRD